MRKTSMPPITLHAVEKGREMSDMGDVNVAVRAKTITAGIIKGLEKMRKKRS